MKLYGKKIKKQHERLCQILKEMLRNDPRYGLGKPEPCQTIVIPAWMLESSYRDVFAYTPSLASGLRQSLPQ